MPFQKRIYRKSPLNIVKVATTQNEADALVAKGYHPGEAISDPNANTAVSAAQLAAEKASHAGPTSARPVKATVGAGFQYYDTTINKAIFVKGDLSTWVDVSGTTVA